MRTVAASALEFLLLGLLGEGPRSGYDLRKVLTRSPMRTFSDSPGAIYPALRRLLVRKWVDAGATVGGRRRQEFRLTPRGGRALVKWLRQPVTHDDVVLRPGELLLRCGFMDPVLPRPAVRRFLADYEAHLRDYLEVLRAYDREHGEKMPLLARLVFRHGLSGYETSARWAQDARATLETSPTASDKPRTKK
jgi:DNA-binding PadR family transcriptional regulator